MRCSPCALAALLAALGLPAWAQVGDGPVAPLTSPPSIYSSTPPSIATRPITPVTPRPAASGRPAVLGVAPVNVAPHSTAESREERRFLREAAAQSRFELDASRLAFSKSGNAKVRELAASLINHHNAVGLELAHLLNSRGMALPMISNEQRRALNQLTKSTGTRFDTVYLQQVGLGQAAVAREYEKAAATIREPQINAWIGRTLATTRYHQNMAERSVHAGPQLARANRPAAKATTPGAVQPVATSSGGRLSVSNTQ